jgi:hypothetical protein
MHPRFRLLAVTAPGLGATLPEAWRSYPNIEDARNSALTMMRDSRVRRVAIVQDVNVLELVEWIEERPREDWSATALPECR